jgi:hypothetical protein
LPDCRTVGLSDCRTVGLAGRQWKTVRERMTAGSTVGSTVGRLSDCRTVGLSGCRNCRTTVGLLSDYCRITVGIRCRTVGPGLRSAHVRRHARRTSLRSSGRTRAGSPPRPPSAFFKFGRRGGCSGCRDQRGSHAESACHSERGGSMGDPHMRVHVEGPWFIC